VPGIPHTRTGKELEVPVKRLLQGAPAEAVVNRAAVDAPDRIDLIDYSARLGAERIDRSAWPPRRSPSPRRSLTSTRKSRTGRSTYLLGGISSAQSSDGVRATGAWPRPSVMGPGRS
jgi:hypothetical protein